MQKKEVLIIPLLALLFGIALFPIIKSGLYSDDIFFFQGTRGLMKAENIQLSDIIFSDVKIWLNSGRFSPLFYTQIRWWSSAIHEVLVYKIILYFLNLLAFFSFSFYLYTVGLSKKIIFLSLLSLLSLLQFRVSYHDAFTTFHGLYPTVVILNFTALSTFHYYFKTQKNIFLIISVFLWVCGLLFNETTLLFLPIYLISIYFFKFRFQHKIVAFKAFLPHFLLLFLFLFFSMYFKWNAPANTQQYAGLQININPLKMIEVFSFQALSTLPLSHFFYELKHHKANDWLLIQERIKQFPIGLMSIFTLFLFGAISIIKNLDSKNKIIKTQMSFFIFTALLLMLLPGAMIMFSLKYQAYTKFGNAYLPVYIQNMGMALLLGIGLNQGMESRFKNLNKATHFLLFFLMLCAIFSTSNNFRHVEVQNRKVFYPSKALELALQNNLWANIQEGDAIILKNNYHWEATEHYKHLFYEKTNILTQVYNEKANEDFLKAQMVNGYELYFPPVQNNDKALVILKTLVINRKNYTLSKPGDFIEMRFPLSELKNF